MDVIKSSRIKIISYSEGFASILETASAGFQDSSRRYTGTSSSLFSRDIRGAETVRGGDFPAQRPSLHSGHEDHDGSGNKRMRPGGVADSSVIITLQSLASGSGSFP